MGDGEANEVKRPGCGSLGITTSEPWVAQKLKYDGGDVGILLKGDASQGQTEWHDQPVPVNTTQGDIVTVSPSNPNQPSRGSVIRRSIPCYVSAQR